MFRVVVNGWGVVRSVHPSCGFSVVGSYGGPIGRHDFGSSVQNRVRRELSSPAVSGQAAGGAVANYFACVSELSKPRLSALVVFTTVGGFALGAPTCWAPLAAATVGTSLAAASANTFNQAWEKENDKLMRRTRGRPLPSGRLTTNQALGWGLMTGTASTSLLAFGVNPVTAALGLANIGLYSLLYTPSKVRTEANTWVGALVGAIPPVMGWTAAGGSIASPEALLLSSLLFLWQFPHFFSLAWFNRKDYAAGGFKMVPVADPTGIRTARHVRNYAVALSVIPFAAYAADVTSVMFAVEGAAINAYAVYLAQQFYKQRTNSNARNVFRFSLAYLPLIGGAMVFHSNYWTDEDKDLRKSHLSLPENRWSEALFDNVPDVGYDKSGGNSNNSTTSGEMTKLVVGARTALKAGCVHEVLTFGSESSPSDVGGRYPQLCPVVVGDEATEKVVQVVAESNSSTHVVR